MDNPPSFRQSICVLAACVAIPVLAQPGAATPSMPGAEQPLPVNPKLPPPTPAHIPTTADSSPAVDALCVCPPAKNRDGRRAKIASAAPAQPRACKC